MVQPIVGQCYLADLLFFYHHARVSFPVPADVRIRPTTFFHVNLPDPAVSVLREKRWDFLRRQERPFRAPDLCKRA